MFFKFIEFLLCVFFVNILNVFLYKSRSRFPFQSDHTSEATLLRSQNVKIKRYSNFSIVLILFPNSFISSMSSISRFCEKLDIVRCSLIKKYINSLESLSYENLSHIVSDIIAPLSECPLPKPLPMSCSSAATENRSLFLIFFAILVSKGNSFLYSLFISFSNSLIRKIE